MNADLQPPFRYPPPELPRRDVVDTWKFLLPFGAVCIGLLLARAWGVL